MKDLKQCRIEIDAIDQQLMELFEKRSVHERYFVSGNYSIRYRRAVPAESGAEG